MFMDLPALRQSAGKGRIEWRRHAAERMGARGISRERVVSTLLSGEVVEEYPDDKPFPAMLVLGGVAEKRPVHVVAAFERDAGKVYIITVYEPSHEKFESDWKTRKPSR
jgi:hypothetical protein